MYLSIKRIFIGCAAVVFISGCGVQQVQHVQSGNLTGKVIDNRWDYYDGNPVHYSSTQRTLVFDGMMAVNETFPFVLSRT